MILGIDFGTTHSLIAGLVDGKPVAFKNAHGDVLTPTAVAVDGQGLVVVGKGAVDICLARPAQGVMDFKRYMGTEHVLCVGHHRLHAHEAAEQVLRDLCCSAALELGQPVTEVVITVPAHFSDAQRQATRLAGELAGLKVLRLINEPTAAALAYGLLDTTEETTRLVFDLGGGTTDVSVLDYFDGVMKVGASQGDNFLGGEDFTQALAQNVLARLPGLPSMDLNPMLRARLWHEAERAKRVLCHTPDVEFSITWADETLRTQVSSADFQKWVEPLLARMRVLIERVLRDARLRASDIDQVVLAGGATRMPLVRQLVARMFGRLPVMHLNPDEVVAMGAAVMGGLLASDKTLDEVVMSDNCPYSLGIESSTTSRDGSQRDGLFSILIERNTALPVSRVERFVTTSDNQRVVAVRVYQGESLQVCNNILLGELKIQVPPKPAGEVALDVRFTYDASSILEVGVQVDGEGAVQTMVLQRGLSALSPDHVAQRLQALAQLKQHPRDQQVNVALKARAERLFEESLGRERAALGDCLLAFEAALASQDEAQIAAPRQRLQHLVTLLDNAPVR